MAIQEHLKLLKENVDDFNVWRSLNPGVVPDLTGANLTSANLNSANLTYVDLTRAELSDADLSGADLRNAELAGVQLSNANLTGAIIDAHCAKSLLPFKAIGRAAKDVLVRHLNDIAFD